MPEPYPATLRVETVVDVIITVTVRRDLNQHLIATARAWMPRGGGRELCQVSYDTAGGVPAETALEIALSVLLDRLRQVNRPQVPSTGP